MALNFFSTTEKDIIKITLTYLQEITRSSFTFHTGLETLSYLTNKTYSINSSNEIDQEDEKGTTSFRVSEITVNCHPELVSGSQ